MAIIIKSEKEIGFMRQAGRIVAAVLALLVENIRPGITTGELDSLARRELERHHVIPSFLGYRGYPASLCVSINEEVVHGIPGGRILQEGDVVSLDLGAIYRGFHGDAAVTVGVGKIHSQAEELIRVTQGALEVGIAAALPGGRLSDISCAIQSYVESRGFSVVREYVGHGIGREMHEEPQVPNFGEPGLGPVLRRGMTIALEPMVNVGGWRTLVRDDHWTVITADGSISAHFEHTIAITDGAAEVLTRL